MTLSTNFQLYHGGQFIGGKLDKISNKWSKTYQLFTFNIKQLDCLCYIFCYGDAQFGVYTCNI